jgi:membrane protease YdiL (CAAX protease family)
MSSSEASNSTPDPTDPTDPANPSGSELPGNPKNEGSPPPLNPVWLAASSAGEVEISPRERYENWMTNNIAPLMVTGAGMMVLILAILATPFVIHGHISAPKESTVPVVPEGDEANSLRFGLGATFVFISLMFSIPGAWQWLFRFPKRAMPALRVLDLAAILTVMTASFNMILLLAYALRPHIHVGSNIKTAAHLLINDASMMCGMICAIFLARFRAGGKHGSYGLWPFWSVIDKRRPIWKDILLGIASYPVIYILVIVFVLLSQIVLKAFGKPLDQNPVIDQILPVQGGWQLWVVVLTVTFGAGFFEEVLFRGVLYNVARRYLGALGGAIASAFIFAALHGTLTEASALFVLAMVLTWLYERTGRLIASMTLHILNNGMVMLSLWYAHSGAGKH